MPKNYHDIPDDALVSMTLLGEQDAYEELVRRYQRPALNTAYLSLKNRFLAEDAAQDAFVTAWLRLNTLREPARFGPWVCRIAGNTARNMVKHYRDYLPPDEEEITALAARRDYVQWQKEQAEESVSETLRQSLDRLSEKVRTVIRLHYFEGLSVTEIAYRLSIPAGTVKYRLHEGREKLRKELDMMNGNEMEKFVNDVMKKVEKLKSWRYRNDKTGFSAYYKDVLAEVEKIPEEGYSAQKNHAMADVLMRGFWWLPEEEKGDKDALLARIRECCDRSHNEDVKQFLLVQDYEKISGKERLDFMRQEIAKLEEEGYVQALGYEWFWLGYYSQENGDRDAMFDCYRKVLEVLTPADVYYANALAAIKLEESIPDRGQQRTYYGGATGEEYRYEDGKLFFDKQPGYSTGELINRGNVPDAPFYFISRCDNRFPDASMKPGESITASDGKVVLTFAEDNITVETPAGTFDGCGRWTITGGWKGDMTFWMKPGVGLIRFSQRDGDEILTLKAYKITGGEGLLPMAVGNCWEYTAEKANDLLTSWETYEVTYTDKEKVILSGCHLVQRKGYADTWEDQFVQTRAEYVAEEGDREWLAKDMRPTLAHAAELADTPFRKDYTAAAQKVMEEIWTTDPEASPGCPVKGYWNFFSPFWLRRTDDGWTLDDSYPYHFEWKDVPLLSPLLYNWVWDILQDAAGCIWSDKWVDGYTEKREYDGDKTSDIRVEAVESLTVPAGTYANCLRVHVYSVGQNGGHGYRGGKMYYDFAPGVGIVQAVHYYMDNGAEQSSRFVLTEAAGTGEGYMPLADGFRRIYTLVDVPETVLGRTEYTVRTDEKGRMVLIAALFGSRVRTEEEIAKDTETK
ncbi:MAG: sigma-70 family RNA polymerase sigma factor [Clostridia bacterium]|nr:sigma-70 family RNA polymerase sigma factor [Clostridia bacterium]